MQMQKTKCRVGLVYRPQSPKAFEVAQGVANWLHDHKCEIWLHPDNTPLPFSKHGLKKGPPRNCQMIIVLGGDGTFLEAVRWLQGESIPILGINLGHLGFLTETKIEELYDTLELAIKKKMRTAERSTIEAKLFRRKKLHSHFSALNDVVIERGPRSRLIDIAVHTSGRDTKTSDALFVSNIKADGLILATPTGSTAYCLAAGGPIVQPTVKAITMTPICPHTLTNRPIIFSDDQIIRLKLNQDCAKAVLMIDGRRQEDLTHEDELMVQRGSHPVVMLTLPTRNYFDVLRSKLRFGQRE